MWNKYTKKRKNVIVLEHMRLDIIMAVIYCYLESENYEVLKLHVNNFSYFEISASLV